MVYLFPTQNKTARNAEAKRAVLKRFIFVIILSVCGVQHPHLY